MMAFAAHDEPQGSVSTPKISVAMATYNGQRFVAEQLDSILNQTLQPLEVVICDDSSSDQTVKVISSIESKIVRVYENDVNLGYIKNFEKACSLCNGDYIALADQDDIWEPTKLEVLASKLRALSADGIFSDALLIDDTGNVLDGTLWNTIKYQHTETALDKRFFYLGRCVTGCTSIFKRSLIDIARPFPSVMPHDWWLAYVSASHNALYSVPLKLQRYRLHGGNAIGISSFNKRKSVWARIIKLANNVFGFARIHRHKKWHEALENRFSVMLAFEKTHLNDVSEELISLTNWITEKYSSDSVLGYESLLERSSKNKLFELNPKRIKRPNETFKQGRNRLIRDLLVAWGVLISLVLMFAYLMLV
ncbi:MAG: glycosyltransferase family 2 protein [Pseudomonadales bacterium]|nr:MAG: glycosyltransferase family 2 protein [Pseudomonadales bacterium]